MKKLLVITLTLLTILGHLLFAQSTQSHYQINFVSSSNGKFYLKSIPYDNIVGSPSGKTIIYNADSNVVHIIPRYFYISPNWMELYLSNDGETIVYIKNRELRSKVNSNAAISFFGKEGIVKEVWLDSIISCDAEVEDCQLLYKDVKLSKGPKDGKWVVEYAPNASDFEKSLCERAIYHTGDSVVVFCRTGIVATVDIDNRSLSIIPLSEFDSLRLEQLDTFSFSENTYEAPMCYGFPNTLTGEEVTTAFAKFAGMKPYDDKDKDSKKFKKYRLNVVAMFDQEGRCEVVNIRNFDSIPQSILDSFFKTQLFNVDFVPEGIDKWRCEVYLEVRNKSNKVAKEERIQELIKQNEERKRLATADSINGFYIPRNLGECFIELDKLLKEKDITEIRNLKDKNETIQYHHGLGTWLRNTWGLWAGSRLSIYFANKGLFHPDDMSATILEFYYDWLKGDHTAWKEFEKK